ncbi:MAG TPA: hypothetical protein VMV86_02615 [Methanosarcinales archaeon]|nr:hypothetical protein [Methanosarcinales archaeon]
MIIKIERIVYDFKLRNIIVYCSNDAIYVFCNREKGKNIFPKSNWIDIVDSEVETLSHTEVIQMVGGRISEGDYD